MQPSRHLRENGRRSAKRKLLIKVELARGIEPPTCGLQRPEESESIDEKNSQKRPETQEALPGYLLSVKRPDSGGHLYIPSLSFVKCVVVPSLVAIRVQKTQVAL